MGDVDLAAAGMIDPASSAAAGPSGGALSNTGGALAAAMHGMDGGDFTVAGGASSSAWHQRQESTIASLGPAGARLRVGASPRASPTRTPRTARGRQNLPFAASVTNVHLGYDCEKEIDRLVREKLEANTGRTNAKAGYGARAQYMDTWPARLQEMTRSGGWAFLEAADTLFGKMKEKTEELMATAGEYKPTGCQQCVKQAIPIIIFEGKDEETVAPENDEFNDIVAPAATKVAEPTTPSSSRGDDEEEQEKGKGKGKGKKGKEGKGKPGDGESTLSAASVPMTSQAAQLLGGGNANGGPSGGSISGAGE